ncbi:hypothetical protein LCGC14_1092270 [marine sediment metagenome]|uniref:Uncharacterized protein n=1 Tax=marine sediment metagenome TaxID=412755 RepID=A0A0F9MGC9_9ZZZZ
MKTIKELEIAKTKLIKSADNYRECKRLFDTKLKTLKEVLDLMEEEYERLIKKDFTPDQLLSIAWLYNGIKERITEDRSNK